MNWQVWRGKLGVQLRTDINRAQTIGHVAHRHATATHPQLTMLVTGPPFADGSAPLVGIKGAMIVELLLMRETGPS